MEHCRVTDLTPYRSCVIHLVIMFQLFSHSSLIWSNICSNAWVTSEIRRYRISLDVYLKNSNKQNIWNLCNTALPVPKSMCFLFFNWDIPHPFAWEDMWSLYLNLHTNSIIFLDLTYFKNVRIKEKYRDKRKILHRNNEFLQW